MAVLLEGPTWTLTELDGKALADEGRFRSYVTFDPGSRRVSGSVGVNSISGRFKRKGNSLKIVGLVSTLMAGPEPLMSQESQFVKALESTTSFELKGTSLRLLRGAKVLATLILQDRGSGGELSR